MALRRYIVDEISLRGSEEVFSISRLLNSIFRTIIAPNPQSGYGNKNQGGGLKKSFGDVKVIFCVTLILFITNYPISSRVPLFFPWILSIRVHQLLQLILGRYSENDRG